MIDVGARADRTTAVFERELGTLARNRLYPLLAVGFAALIVAIALGSDVSGYVPLVATLLTPIELLVPVLVAAMGYRSILGDRERGELDVLRTYPATREEYVVGVFLGRLVAITATVVAPLLAVGVAVPV
ncbi:ABC transporter permease, partial [Natronoarchaeum mannanilyticum]